MIKGPKLRLKALAPLMVQKTLRELMQELIRELLRVWESLIRLLSTRFFGKLTEVVWQKFAKLEKTSLLDHFSTYCNLKQCNLGSHRNLG